MSIIADYVRAGTIDEVAAALSDTTTRIQLIAGGTDLLTRLQRTVLAEERAARGSNLLSSEPLRVIDISNVRELDGIRVTSDGLHIGAATRLVDVERSPWLISAWRVLADGAAKVGSPQIRNLATLGGNVCNASPAADTVPPLLVLDAVAEIVSSHGRRTLPLADFFVGPGRTRLEPGEFLAGLRLPHPPAGAVAVYIKHSPRQAMDLAVVGVAVLLAPPPAESVSRTGAGYWVGRIALGAVASTPLRATAAEQALAGGSASGADKAFSQASQLAAAAVAPIDDIRASAEYRRELVAALTDRALQLAAAQMADAATGRR
jgi:carbon-monoxide dehydrogenase medium subunit